MSTYVFYNPAIATNEECFDLAFSLDDFCEEGNKCSYCLLYVM